MKIHTINGQSAALNLSNEQLQVILTGKFGDGYISCPKNENSNSIYSTNCIHKEYIEYKKFLLGDLSFNINSSINKGFKNNIIYRLSTHANDNITSIYKMSLEDSLNLMDDLGLALWFYDDGSLHKDKLFYNLNTQAYSREINEDLFIPFLKNFDIDAKTTIERKSNGKEYWYLRIGKFDGAKEISEILSKYYVSCFDYKIWSSETIQKWSKLQAQLKSIPVDISTLSKRTLSSLLNKELSTEDIVRTLTKVEERKKKRLSRNK